MVLAAVDDLLFSSKIRTVARHVGVEVVFARSPEAVLEQVRAARPALAIFDLNSAKTDPVRTIAAIKGDAEMRATRVVGFVSHVQTATIEAARAAGADAVMARSAFAAELADILGRAK
jgi:DNA-binding NarL/FixJ family response regulator